MFQEYCLFLLGTRIIYFPTPYVRGTKLKSRPAIFRTMFITSILITLLGMKIVLSEGLTLSSSKHTNMLNVLEMVLIDFDSVAFGEDHNSAGRKRCDVATYQTGSEDGVDSEVAALINRPVIQTNNL